MHKQIGERQEIGYGVRVGEIAAELAVHFERGRDYPKAIRYLEQVARNAIQRSAHQEAIDHLSKGLELLKILPEIPERIRQELFLRTTMGSVFVATKGYAAPEVAKAYARAQELCQQLGESPQLFTVLRGLWTFHLLQAKLQEARELAKRLLTAAQNVQEPSLFLEAHLALGVTSYFMGELALAREHLEEVILLYNPQQYHSHTLLYGGSDPRVSCLSISAWTLWSLGYLEQALKRSQKVLALAREFDHPYSTALHTEVVNGSK